MPPSFLGGHSVTRSIAGVDFHARRKIHGWDPYAPFKDAASMRAQESGPASLPVVVQSDILSRGFGDLTAQPEVFVVRTQVEGLARS